MLPQQKVVDIATEEIGYLEKANANDLDDKTANAGSANYTKYSRDLWAVRYFNGAKQGVAWCAVFVSWCYFQAFGKDKALKLQCQPTSNNSGAGCTSAMNYYKRKNRWSKTPEWGDQIFFYTKGDTSTCSHTGLVVGVEGNKVITIEGNTSAGPQVIPNGGAVCKKSYDLSNARIAGYGHPDWSIVDGEDTPPMEDNNKMTEVNYMAKVVAASGSTVNLRAQPSTDAQKLYAVPVGNTVQVVAESTDWCQIIYGQQTGYMMRKFLEKTTSTPTGGSSDIDAAWNDLLIAVEKMRIALGK